MRNNSKVTPSKTFTPPPVALETGEVLLLAVRDDLNEKTLFDGLGRIGAVSGFEAVLPVQKYLNIKKTVERLHAHTTEKALQKGLNK